MRTRDRPNLLDDYVVCRPIPHKFRINVIQLAPDNASVGQIEGPPGRLGWVIGIKRESVEGKRAPNRCKSQHREKAYEPPTGYEPMEQLVHCMIPLFSGSRGRRRADRAPATSQRPSTRSRAVHAIATLSTEYARPRATPRTIDLLRESSVKSA